HCHQLPLRWKKITIQGDPGSAQTVKECSPRGPWWGYYRYYSLRGHILTLRDSVPHLTNVNVIIVFDPMYIASMNGVKAERLKTIRLQNPTVQLFNRCIQLVVPGYTPAPPSAGYAPHTPAAGSSRSRNRHSSSHPPPVSQPSFGGHPTNNASRPAMPGTVNTRHSSHRGPNPVDPRWAPPAVPVPYVLPPGPPIYEAAQPYTASAQFPRGQYPQSPPPFGGSY
ncbi:hypothetical protein R3P38DRAFT_3592524, partial [Favolaschia claudopus]